MRSRIVSKEKQLTCEHSQEPWNGVELWVQRQNKGREEGR